MADTPLESIHAELLAQFADIIRVCQAHDIDYNLMCGSLLGAVRHQGFIPWDDDIDLLMTRENFAKFEAFYPREHDPRFLLSYTNTWTPRVMSKDPQIADAFVDLFILDVLPDSPAARKRRFLHLRLLQGMLKENVDYTRFSLPQRCLLRATHWLGLPFSRAWKCRRYAQVSQATKAGTRVHMSNGAFQLMSTPWDPEWFRAKQAVPFEDLTALIPLRYDEILTVLFGKDYMTPPPPEERVAKHLDL